MKRAGIVVIYSKEGKLGRYRQVLLEELTDVLDDIWIVINGRIDESEIIDLRNRYDHHVYVRENKGFDAEAYGDVLQKYYTVDVLKEYDELVFCNDTFYGPFVPFKDIFKKMDGLNVDYWGMDRIKRGFLSYIIMYFCVFRKKVFCNGWLHKYFKENVCGKVNTISDAFARFEAGLSYHLKHNGFTMDSFTCSEGLKSMCNPDTCIIEKGLPIWKRKFFKEEIYDENRYERIMEYLRTNSNYDLSVISDETLAFRRTLLINGKGEILDGEVSAEEYDIPDTTEEDIRVFIKRNQQRGIYVWGNGSFGRATVFLFLNNNSFFKGYIESYPKTSKSSDGYLILSKEEVSKEAAIIVAMNRNHTKEVAEMLRNYKYKITFWENEL